MASADAPTAAKGRERFGILGGTFDPVHVGHLVAAIEAREQLAFDRMALVVAGDPWQKQGRVVAPALARLDMVRAAVTDVEGLEVSDIEVAREGPTYMIDTVEHLGAADRDIFLVIGADAARGLDGWHRSNDLRNAVTLAVLAREGDPAPPLEGWRQVPVSMPRLDVSSTALRARVARGAAIDFYVPPGAVRVIRDRRLYTPE